MRHVFAGLAAIGLAAACSTPVSTPTQSAASAPISPPEAVSTRQAFSVMLAPGNDPMSGRLIVTATAEADVRLTPGDTLNRPRFLSPSSATIVAAQEAHRVSPGQPTHFDADTLAFPLPMSRIAPGEYWVQVRLDTDHDFAHRASPDLDTDLVSVPVKMTLPTAAPIRVTLMTERAVAAPETPAPAAGETCNGQPRASLPAQDAADAAFAAQLRDIDFLSPSLSEFWGRDIEVCGYILLPPGYADGNARYPVVYRTEGFGASLAGLPRTARQHWNMMTTGETPPMIRVYLDHSSPWGTHEFADSVNNGPWGLALTQELIPWLEEQYRMDARPEGRFVTGHSSGGWFAMWQQVRYPDVFGGAWARAPDPVDFRSFTGVDIYAPNANAYRRPDGSDQYLMRDAQGNRTTTLKTYAQRENVLGDFGGQFDSFDWVFSPRGKDGRPMPLFDRITGEVDPDVARYWRDNFDVGYIIRRDWTSLREVLDGKIHLIMGTLDTFHLDEAARLLEADMKKLGARADFMWMEGRTHGTLDRIEDDPMGLEKKIAWEMWAVARPNSTLKAKPPAS